MWCGEQETRPTSYQPTRWMWLTGHMTTWRVESVCCSPNIIIVIVLRALRWWHGHPSSAHGSCAYHHIIFVTRRRRARKHKSFKRNDHVYRMPILLFFFCRTHSSNAYTNWIPTANNNSPSILNINTHDAPLRYIIVVLVVCFVVDRRDTHITWVPIV